MRDETLPLWRPDIVQGRTPTVVSSDLCTIPDINLHCGAMRLAVNAVCSVACLAWTGREGRAEALGSMALEQGRYLPERLFAKEDKNRLDLWWKAPRLS
jgi:hypothetical protein